MKKILTFFTIMILSVGSVAAQKNYRTITGYVVDKNGNPIPGAEVTTPGGGESVITDSDGSFNLSVHPLLKKLTASYDGMATKTLKIRPDKDLVFTLKKERKNPAFLNVVLGFSYNQSSDSGYDENGPSWGIMSGMLSRWGFYGKGNCDWNGNFSITAGGIKSIYKRNAFVYVGAGYGMAWNEYDFIYSYPNSTYEYWDYDSDYRPGIAADFGFIFKTGRHFNLTIGSNFLYTLPFHNYASVYVGANYVLGLQLGLGYVF